MPFLTFFRRKSTLIAGGILVIGSLAVLWAYYFTGGRSTHTVQLPPEPHRQRWHFNVGIEWGRLDVPRRKFRPH